MKTARIILLCVAACIALGVWATVQGRAVATQAADRAPLLAATELPLEQITRIQLERTGSPTMVFERSGTAWMQTEPYPHPGDAAALRHVIETAAELEQTRTVDAASLDATARAALGLEPPQAVLTLGWPGGERVIELGRRTVAGRAWARVRGRPQAASVDSTLHLLATEGDPRQWRSIALYDAAPGEAERIELSYGTRAGAQWVLERQSGRWKVVAPFQTRADGEATRSYIEAIARAEADAFAADQPAEFAAFGLAPAAAKVQITRGGGAPAATIEVGNAVTQGAQERFARVDGRPAVLQVGPKALAALLPRPEFFIDARGTDVGPADVRRIEYTPAPGTTTTGFSLDRARDSWTARGNDGQATPANAEAVRRLLKQLCETRAPEVSLNEVPEELRMGQFTLYGEGGAPLAVIRIAREASEGTGKWALDNKDGVLRVFPQNFDLRVDLGSYAGTR